MPVNFLLAYCENAVDALTDLSLAAPDGDLSVEEVKAIQVAGKVVEAYKARLEKNAESSARNAVRGGTLQ